MFLRRAGSHVAPMNWYRPKIMPVAEEYEVDERTNNLTSKDACTYAQLSVSKDRLVFKNGFNSHPVFKINDPISTVVNDAVSLKV